MTEWTEAWIADFEPADRPACTCYDPESMEFGPGYPCEYCRVRDAGLTEKSSA